VPGDVILTNGYHEPRASISSALGHASFHVQYAAAFVALSVITS
jgi:hypothetical protein